MEAVERNADRQNRDIPPDGGRNMTDPCPKCGQPLRECLCGQKAYRAAEMEGRKAFRLESLREAGVLPQKKEAS